MIEDGAITSSTISTGEIMRLIKAFFRSFLLTLFLTVVCSAVITVITIPPVGRVIAEPLCDGKVDSQTRQWSQQNGEFGVAIDYVCIPVKGDSYLISSFDIIKQAAVYYVGFMAVVLWPLLFVISFIRNKKFGRQPRTIYVSTSS